MNGRATVGLFSLVCACGLKVRVLEILERTQTGRETVRHYCHECGTISWWYRTYSPHEKVMLMDRDEPAADQETWPPRNWMHRHCPPRRKK